MTETSMLIGVAVGGAILGAGVLWLFWAFAAGADEEGIRVKSGSVEMETVSREGFEPAGSGKKKFKTKKHAKGKIHIAVSGGCVNEFFVPNVTRVVITVDNVNIDLIDGGEFAVTDTEFKKSADDLLLKRAGGGITRIEAYDETSPTLPVLTCTDADGKLHAYLHISK